MRSRVQLDQLDLKILDSLQSEGRCTNANLAARVGLSESACSARIRQMQSNGVIAGYRLLLGAGTIAPSVTVLAAVKLDVGAPARLAAFERYLEGIPSVVECDLVTGEFDYLLRVVAPDVDTYLKIADDCVANFKGVKTWVTNVVLRRAKDSPLKASALNAFSDHER
jgi:Lrp/AsnC family transcriptional regulator, leucine-responsive regulatory protein